MSVTLPPADRKLLLMSGVVLTVLLLAVALLQPQEEETTATPSTYSADSGGAKAAYLLLKESGYRVGRWDHPPSELPPGNTDTLLILADPRWLIEPQDKMAVQRFVAGGGRVLATGMSGASLLPEAHILPADPTKRGWQKYSPAVPSALTRGGDITLDAWGHWDQDKFAILTHYAREDEAVIVSYEFGRGQVTWWAGSTPLTNAGIRESGNMELFLNCVGHPSTRIYWDEYFHGARPGPWSKISDTPLPWAMAQAGLLFLAVLFTFARRSGPVRPLVGASRLSPLEFVETLGGVYQSARASQVAVEVSYQRFQYLVSKRLGLAGNPTAAEMARAIEQRLRYDRPGFAAKLERLEQAIGDPNLREKEAVALVQALNDFSRDLQLIPGAHEEKN